LGEVNRLNRAQSPGQLAWVAVPDKHRNYPIDVVGGSQRKLKFPSYPHRSQRRRREDDQEPIATFERLADFVMPLLRADKMRCAVPKSNSVSAKNFYQANNKALIVGSVRNKELAR